MAVSVAPFLANPFVILALSIGLVVALIGVWRVHAFLALILAASLVALAIARDGEWAAGIESVMTEFGRVVGSIGFSIAIAAVIGAALLESGAADRIVRTFLAALGEKRAPLALVVAGFILGVPVFFDTVFFLLVPLVRALSARTGRNYTLHLLAICAGSVITHATVPPTPGPLAMAEILRLDLGQVLLVGAVAGILPALGGLWFAHWCERHYGVPLRAAADSTVEEVVAIAQRDPGQLPGFAVSIAPVIVPVLLIALASIGINFRASLPPGLVHAVLLLGNKNVALLIGAVIAIAVYLRQRRLSWRQTEGVVGAPLATAGAIILITAAGGAYGAMIKQAGIGDALGSWAGAHGINPILLAWGMAALIRAAQGSTTVAVITTSSLMMSLGGESAFNVHPLYLYLAIGYGGLFLSWMNDSGFWIYSRMSGLTERETLRSWTVLLSLVSLFGLAEVLVASALFPGLP